MMWFALPKNCLLLIHHSKTEILLHLYDGELRIEYHRLFAFASVHYNLILNVVELYWIYRFLWLSTHDQMSMNNLFFFLLYDLDWKIRLLDLHVSSQWPLIIFHKRCLAFCSFTYVYWTTSIRVRRTVEKIFCIKYGFVRLTLILT